MTWRSSTLALGCGLALAATCAHAQPASGDGSALPPLGDDLPASAALDASPPADSPRTVLDLPVGQLCGHPETRAVIDRDLPGLSRRPEYVFFKHMSLRQLQAASRGRMSDADLQRVAADLGAVDAADAPVRLVSASDALR